MEKIILHCDLNNFYASVECLKYPQYKNLPVAVCGDPKERRGVILAKNEVAKKFGVKTAETVWQAQQKCPDLILLASHMDEYIAFSQKARKIYSKYTDLIQPFGIDECWLDVTGSTLLFGTGEQIANTIRKDIKESLGLTVSVGVSFNKIFAKLGSDYKKPDAVTCITKDNFKNIVWPLSAADLLGVGKSTYQKLQKYNINTIGDLANANQKFLSDLLGKNGFELWKNANGLGDANVEEQNHFELPKSIGNSTTCPSDLLTPENVWTVLYRLSESVSSRLLKQNLLAKTVQISVKDNTLTTHEFQAPLKIPSRHPLELAKLGFSLFTKNYSWQKPIRAVGIKTTNLILESESTQYNIFYDYDKMNALENLEENIINLRDKYGDQSIMRASLMRTVKEIKQHEFDETSLPKL